MRRVKKMLIVGAGGHAQSLVDAVEAAGSYEIAGFVDVSGTPSYRGYGVIGEDGDLPALRASGIAAAAIGVGFLGENSPRREIRDNLLAAGFELPAIIDPSAVVAADAEIAPGVFVGKAAVVNSGAWVGEMAIVNTAAIVEHGCTVGAFSHIAVNATLCGNVFIGEEALVGAGATVIQGVSVGSRALVGAGAVVLRDVPEGVRALGVYRG